MRAGRPIQTVVVAGMLPLLGACGSLTGADELPLPIPAVRASAASNTEVMLEWPRMGLSPIGEIRVERSVEGGSFSEIAVLAGDAGEYLDAGLSPSTRYRYRLRVCREVGCSAYTYAPATTPSTLPSPLREPARAS